MEDGEKIALWDNKQKGDIVIFIHGFPENHLCWKKLFKHLSSFSSTPYRFIAYDLRGYGESSKQGEATWQRFFQDHLNIVSSLGLVNYHLVGHDWGGAIALHVSRFFPETLRSVTVLNTNFWKTDLFGMWHLIFLNLPFIAPIVFRFFPEAFFNLVVVGSFKNSEALEKDVRQSYLNNFRDKESVRYWIRLYRGMARSLIGQYCPRWLKPMLVRTKVQLPQRTDRAFQVPTALIWGKKDTFNPLWVGQDIYEKLKRRGVSINFHEIEDSGHFVQEEQPELVAKELLSHWERSCRK